jgi:hypothetical protein
MRQIIIRRINDLKEKSGNFSSGMRWDYRFYGVRIQDVDYGSLNDEPLLAFFELIIRRYNVQM